MFEATLKELSETLDFWDRTTVQVRRPPSPSEKSEFDDHPPPSAKRGVRGKGEFCFLLFNFILQFTQYKAQEQLKVEINIKIVNDERSVCDMKEK